MDHARKIGKRSQKPSDVWTKPPRACRTTRLCRTTKTSEPAEEDHRLANWRRWLSDHQRRQKYLSSVLDRQPIDLVLNAHERVRGRNETRYLMQAAVRSEVTNQDRYRGNPAFWKGVDRLIGNGDEEEEEEEDDDVVAYKDRDARNLPPVIDRVGLSNLIKREKMLVESCVDASKINLASKWECGDYLLQRKSELKSELKFLEEKQPETDELAITGRNFQSCNEPKQTTFIQVPVIVVTPAQVKKHLLHDLDARSSLKIQDREFVLEKARHFERLSLEESRRLQETHEDKNELAYAYSLYEFDRVHKLLSKKSEPITWSLTFQTHGNELATRHLDLENRGAYVVKLHWRKQPDPSLPFPLAERLDSPFFFDKNHLTLLPGQRTMLPFWFRSERPLTATETWKLETEPRIYPGDFYLRLWGTSEGQQWKDLARTKNEAVKSRLRIKMRNTMLRRIVEEIVSKATSEPYLDSGVPYECYFLEPEVFEARNPGYYYRSFLVDELKTLFAESTGYEWNLSLMDLRSVLLGIEDPVERREKLQRFREIRFQCLRPVTIYERSRPSKEQVVRWLLCGLFDKFEEESNFVVSALCSEEREDNDEGEESDDCFDGLDFSICREVFYLRIWHLLRETLDKACAAIDAHDFFNKEKAFD